MSAWWTATSSAHPADVVVVRVGGDDERDLIQPAERRLRPSSAISEGSFRVVATSTTIIGRAPACSGSRMSRAVAVADVQQEVDEAVALHRPTKSPE